jgi:3-oxoacyl-[acyl-carrier-protein] synthase II
MKQAVITGVGVVSPLGTGWSDWAQGLREGHPGVRAITLFDPKDPQGEPLSCRVAAQVPGFEPEAHIEPGDLKRVARSVPMALCAAREAVCSSGLDFSQLSLEESRDFSVVIGSGGGGFSFAESQFSLWYSGQTKGLSPYAVSSSIAGMVSSEISIALGLRGRSHTISDGCTSSSDAFGYALDMIRSGRSKRVLCGGVDAPITPGTIAAFCLMRAVPTHWNEQPERAARPFDSQREGFVLGEGAWLFVLEEREAALERGARIRAEIAGYGASCEAFHRVALSTPDEGARAMREAMQDAGVAPEEIDYVNLHGTGTRQNDPLETAAVKLALGERAFDVPMSGTKSQIGHPQGASGAAGIAAALAAMEGGFVPPTINLESPDPECDLDYVPNQARLGEVSTALCNCLGFGSKNAAVVLKKG